MSNPRNVTNLIGSQETKDGAGDFIWRSIGKQYLPEPALVAPSVFVFFSVIILLYNTQKLCINQIIC